MNAVIQIQQLCAGYKQGAQITEVIRNLNMSVQKGEIIGVIGENGIGKSTMLRTLTRDQLPLSGSILIDGKELHAYSRNEFARKVSFVSTETIRLNHCTVKELVSFGRYPYTNWFGQLSHDDENAIIEAISMVGLLPLADRNINEISDGERQRVMIARTLAQDTDIIILDEPTAFLDMPNKFEIIHLLSELTRTKNKTIIFSSHDLSIAMKEADRLWLMMPGEFIDGAPEDLALQHSISKIFRQTRLKFDNHKGEFSISRKYVGSCKLTGKGIVLNWTKRALERLGYDTENEHAEHVIEIIIHENGSDYSWELLDGEKTSRFGSVYELAAHLKKVCQAVDG
jgi:iron complex transport system ATP-binding protein